MGEIADAILIGDMCQFCSEILRGNYGYPVACRPCWEGLSKAERKLYQLAERG